jgi:fructosamine-3-kinase
MISGPEIDPLYGYAMNVMDELLKEKIDPFLTSGNLSIIASRSLKRKVKATAASILSGGCWNRVLSVSFEDGEKDIVFKISHKRNDEDLIREYKVLKFFYSQTDLPVPVPYYLDESCSTIPGTLFVMQKIPGEVLHHTISRLSKKMREGIFDQISSFVIRLHENNSIGFGGVELPEEKRFKNWPNFWLPRFDAAFKEIRAKNLVSPRFISAVEKIRPHLLGFLDIGNKSTLTHYDIWSGNIMIDFQDGDFRVSGFIDIPGFWADYARELSFMEMFGVANDRFYTMYRERYKQDSGFTNRKNIYNLKMHMRHIVMYPEEPYYRKGAEKCLEAIQKAS